MPRDLVTVTSYPTVVEAETVRGLLEAEGIRAFVADGEAATVRPDGWGAVAAIQVSREDAARASAIIREHEEEIRASREAAADGEEEGKETCISCGAEFPEYLDRCPACGLSYG